MHFRPSDTFWNFFTLSSTQDSCFPLLSAMSFSQLSPFFLTKDFNTCPVWPLEGVDGGGFFLLPGVVFLVFSVVFCSVVFLDLWSFIPFTAIQMAVGLSNQKSKWFTFCFCAVKTVCFVPSSTESPWPVQTGESEASVTPCTITQPVLQHPLPPSSHEPVLMTQQHQTLGTNTTHHYCLDGQMLSCMGMGGEQQLQRLCWIQIFCSENTIKPKMIIAKLLTVVTLCPLPVPDNPSKKILFPEPDARLINVQFSPGLTARHGLN